MYIGLYGIYLVEYLDCVMLEELPKIEYLVYNLVYCT